VLIFGSADREDGLSLMPRKKTVRSPVTAAGSSAGAKCPPRGRPERRGITRAVSPKKIGERKKGNVHSLGTPRRREDQHNGQRSSKSVTAAPWKSPMMAWSTVCDDYFRVADDPTTSARAPFCGILPVTLFTSPCIPLVKLGECCYTPS
jgi:hypothetical protein